VDAGGLAPPSDAAPAVAAHDVVRAAQEALDKVDAEGTASNLTDFQRVSLEAIVQLTGRPAMRYTNGMVQQPPNNEGDNERWRVLIATARGKINKASASVGQVGLVGADGTAEAIGTAWRLGTDLVVTNRHVAETFVLDRNVAPSQWKYDPGKPAVVNFTVTDDAQKTIRFDVAEIVFVADEQPVDMAIFRLKPGTEKFPSALPLDFDADSIGRDVEIGGVPRFQGEEIYVVGHPFRAAATSATASVFGVADGFKRCSPGLVTAISQFEHAFEHDSSTLGGNSGSCVLSVSGHKVVGLHYGGVGVNANQVGLANVALGLARLAPHPASAILKAGKIP
ncbi:MAG TPA: serine protease, partial [Thermoanaerobaculia bacterium]